MKKKEFILPMRYNPGHQKYEPDLEKIKEIGNYLRKKNVKKKFKK